MNDNVEPELLKYLETEGYLNLRVIDGVVFGIIRMIYMENKR